MSERKATVLLVDYSKGRTGATAEAYANSPQVGRILATGRNDLIKYNTQGKEVITFPNLGPTDKVNITRLAKQYQVDLVDVLQDESFPAGVPNYLREHHIPTVGASRGSSRVEWDKLYGRRLMWRNDILIPGYVDFTSAAAAKDYYSTLNPNTPQVIKANFLAGGKGVVTAHDKAEVEAAIDYVSSLPNEAGRQFLMETKVGGKLACEFSGFYLGTYRRGKQYFDRLGFARDYKRVRDNDEGPNTGSMGSVASPELMEEELKRRTDEEIVARAAVGLATVNTPFEGIFFVGGMYDPETEELWTIEFNSRWGDAEAEVLLPDIGKNNDLFELSQLVAKRSNDGRIRINHDDLARVCLTGAARGYPGDYSDVKGRKLEGLREVIERGEVSVYGGGIAEVDGDFYVAGDGGRLFNITGTGDDVRSAKAAADNAMARIHIPGDRPGEDLLHYRTDIGA